MIGTACAVEPVKSVGVLFNWTSSGELTAFAWLQSGTREHTKVQAALRFWNRYFFRNS